MQLDITGHHVDLSKGLKEKVEKSVKKLEEHFNHISYIHVTLNVDNKTHKAEAKVNLDHHTTPIFAESSNADMYKSIDDMVNKLNKQIIKHKEKLQQRGHNESLG
ncbi:MAG: ribosome-associated translation inhibitor RaiA [Francisellaceae bacterium]|jgi:putative sigma-54 modulation protein|nr:ribosome-associated translation inhibitor RaiA [Francisellaceae bacterium]MBT6208342.1 ribosome-associated translation inhibitor RaiA [Francisellaceae bacterium]MBT6539489.1 ribosome-associated translation inhibitor RaiA [Francisellaceae bacterium]